MVTKESIKLPRSSYDELRKIIAAYGKLDKPSGLQEISTLSGIGRTRVSGNNAFLTTIGLIEGGKLKSATSKGKALAHALEHDITDDVEKTWATVVQENEFLNKILQAIGIRKGMEPSQLETHIAYSAGEPKSGAAMTGARTVIDILHASGLVVEEDGHIKPNPASSIVASVSAASDESIPRSEQAIITSRTQIRQVPSTTQITLHIEVRINATPSELDNLGDKLKALVSSLAQTKPEDPSNQRGN